MEKLHLTTIVSLSSFHIDILLPVHWFFSFHSTRMADPTVLEQDAVNFATRAIACDQNLLADTAIFYYHVTISYQYL